LVHELICFVQAEWRRRRDNRLKQTKVAERGRSPPNPTYDRLSFYIDPCNLAEGAGNELCRRLIDYRFVFSVKGMDPILARRTHFWLLLQAKCPFCTHRKCGECREVSFSILACCQCRSRAIERLHALQKLLSDKDEKNG
jgi:hypothetical protein